MATLIVWHKVEDYGKWRTVFDSMESVRQSFGSTGTHVFRAADDPNEIVILTDWGTTNQAKDYAQSPDLREGMKQAGVTSQPTVMFVD